MKSCSFKLPYMTLLCPEPIRSLYELPQRTYVFGDHAPHRLPDLLVLLIQLDGSQSCLHGKAIASNSLDRLKPLRNETPFAGTIILVYFVIRLKFVYDFLDFANKKVSQPHGLPHEL